MSLMSLIPQEHHSFYESLPDSQNPDLNTYPDIDEIDPDGEGRETDEEEQDTETDEETEEENGKDEENETNEEGETD